MRKIFPLKGFQIALVIIISALIGYAYGTNKISLSWKEYRPIVSIEGKAPPAGQTINMSLLYEVLDKVNQGYYDKSKLDSTKLLYGAVNGMLSSLDDPYTSFFPPKQNTEFKTQLAGEFTGIGAELSTSSDGRIMVVAPLDDSPAQKAGVRSGDIILKVNEDETAGWPVAKAVEKIRGPKGTEVKLTILHEKEKSPKEIKIMRDVIIIKSVTGWVKNILCEKNACEESNKGKAIAYIRLSQFGDKTNDEWISTVNSINSKTQNNKNLAGIILDLRNNPGGYLNDAVFIASEFLSGGVVVIQENNAKEQEALHVSRRGALLSSPLVVLINRGSASASEIVAGALADHKRAKLLGEKSFGKGTIQQAVDVDNGASVHISVAKWLTPNGVWVNKLGLTPNLIVEYDATKSAAMKNGFDNQLEAAMKELL